MATFFVILLIIFVLVGVTFTKEIKNSPYWDEETNRFVPKEEEKEWLENQEKKLKKYLKDNDL